jgi:hypothetical protein
MTLLMLTLFMTAGALMLTIAIRARLVARANFAAIQQTALADTVPREALDEALLAVLRGSISGTTGSVVVTGGNNSLELENLLADKFGSSTTGQGSALAGTDQTVMQVTVRSQVPPKATFAVSAFSDRRPARMRVNTCVISPTCPR